MDSPTSTDRPGLAGLDADMVARIRAGHLSQAEAARLLGVSRQAVSKALERRKASAATVPATEAARATPAPEKRPPEPQVQPMAKAPQDEAEMWAALGGQAWRGLAHAYVTLVTEARDNVVAGRGKIGPTAANGWCRTLRESEEGLRRLGLLPPVAGNAHADQQPAQLAITVLTAEEEAEIRATIEDEVECGGEEDGVSASPEAGTSPSPASVSIINAPLPTPEAFPAWLSSQAYLNGAAWLRNVVSALGGRSVHGKDALIDEVLRLTQGDPQRLRGLLDKAA